MMSPECVWMCPHPLGGPSHGVPVVFSGCPCPVVSPSHGCPVPWCPQGVPIPWATCPMVPQIVPVVAPTDGPCSCRDPLSDTALGHPQPDVLPCDLAPPPRAGGWLPGGPHSPGELGTGTGWGHAPSTAVTPVWWPQHRPNVAIIPRMRWRLWPAAAPLGAP